MEVTAEDEEDGLEFAAEDDGLEITVEEGDNEEETGREVTVEEAGREVTTEEEGREVTEDDGLEITAEEEENAEDTGFGVTVEDGRKMEEVFDVAAEEEDPGAEVWTEDGPEASAEVTVDVDVDVDVDAGLLLASGLLEVEMNFTKSPNNTTNDAKKRHPAAISAVIFCFLFIFISP